MQAETDALIEDARALAILYADTSAAFARAEVVRLSRPDAYDQFCSTLGERAARHKAHRRLLEKLHDLEDAGEWTLSRVIRTNAHANASLAETLATRKALAALREVA